MRHDMHNPGATFSRGQKVRITWARNNHVHGFVRLALVPVEQIHSRSWHHRLALYSGCWAQGVHRCSGDACGADRSRTAFSRTITIPTVYPDGDYVFGMVWFGGPHMPLSQGRFFSDYWSCSFVKIRGGQPLGGTYKAFFDAGDVMKKPTQETRGKCLSAIDAPGVCPKMGCRGPARWGVTKRFRNGNQETGFGVKDVNEAVSSGKPFHMPSEADMKRQGFYKKGKNWRKIGWKFIPNPK